MRIIISGCVGTGKTTISKKLAEKTGLKYVNVNKIIKENPDVITGFDKKRNCKIINEKNLARILEKIDNAIFDSHLSHFMNPKKVKYCIMLRCNPKELKNRLKKRGYSKEKVNENVEAEIMNVCGNEAFEQGHKIIEINTTKKSTNQVIKEILARIS